MWATTLMAPLSDAVPSPDAAHLLGERVVVDHLVETHYAAARDLEAHLDADARATSWAMAEIYHGLLRRIADQPSRAARRRVTLGGWRKATIAWKARRHARRGDS